jgi:hypothetical protein
MTQLLKLAQELDWQVLELRRAKMDPAEIVSSDDEHLERRVIATADKIQRELLATVRFDPVRLFGIGGPIGPTIDALGDLLVAIDKIRQDTVSGSGTLPSTLVSFRGLLKDFCDETSPVAA